MKNRRTILSTLLLSLVHLIIAQSDVNRGFVKVKLQQNGKAEALYEASYALVVGNADYTNGWASLPGVNNDIEEVASTLENEGFTVVKGFNYTKQQLDSTFSAFISTYGNELNTRLLFYYAGHGYTVNTTYGDKLGYLVPIDAPHPEDDINLFQGMSMEMAQIEIYAKRLQSKHALFAFDACFAGSIFSQTRGLSEAISYKTIQPVRQFITSGDENETVPDKSFFRDQFIKAITSTSADDNQDGFVTGTELGEFLQRTVIELSNDKQHPQYGKIRNPSLDKGDFVFVVDSELMSNELPLTPSVGRIARLETDGTLKISSQLWGNLYLDNKLIGKLSSDTTIILAGVKEGKHQIRIEGNENYWQSVEISAGQNHDIYLAPYINEAHIVPFMKMIRVEGGEFNMGDSTGLPDQNPVHPVKLDDYDIGALEVTIRQFSLFVKETGYLTEAEKGSGINMTVSKDGILKRLKGLNWRYQADGSLAKDLSQPVVFVTWNDAIAFTEWMSQRFPGIYRLPTEAEWEYAARGGARRKNTTYAGSDRIEEISRQEVDGDFYKNSARPNELGIYDMSGSVSEWCMDWYDKNFYRKSASFNPLGPTSGTFKVLRGGSKYSDPESMTISYRNKTNPENFTYSDGFRVVRIVQ